MHIPACNLAVSTHHPSYMCVYVCVRSNETVITHTSQLLLMFVGTHCTEVCPHPQSSLTHTLSRFHMLKNILTINTLERRSHVSMCCLCHVPYLQWYRAHYLLVITRHMADCVWHIVIRPFVEAGPERVGRKFGFRV